MVVVLLTAALVAEAGLLQANAAGGSSVRVNEIKERYVFYVVPLVGICFALYAKRGWPARLSHLGLAAAFLILSVRIPLSGFAIAATINASPILFAVYWLTGKLGGPGNAAGLAAAAVAAMTLVAVLASRRPRLGTPVVLGLAMLATAVASAGAVALDITNSSIVRKNALPDDPSWVDRAHVGQVTLLQSAPRVAQCSVTGAVLEPLRHEGGTPSGRDEVRRLPYASSESGHERLAGDNWPTASWPASRRHVRVDSPIMGRA